MALYALPLGICILTILGSVSELGFYSGTIEPQVLYFHGLVTTALTPWIEATFYVCGPETHEAGDNGSYVLSLGMYN